ncbi:MAG: DNA polymerase-3 subunit alpha [Candidatus Promineifilaceae bacterium]|jgi:DNA polymerase-3 subunit alpha
MCKDHDSDFVHLHCHSEYSLLDGLSRVTDLVERAAELGQKAVALTDHGVMYGSMPFYKAAKKAGVKPIIGVETYMAARGMTDRDSKLDRKRCHMLLLAQNQTGYLNMLELATASQLKGYYYKPRIDRPFMAQYSEGLIGTTGCLAGEIPQALMNGQLDQADKLMGEYLDIFGKENFYLELQEHSIPELTEVNKHLIEMAPRFGLENNFLATNDVHYTLKEDAGPHQVLLCIQTGSTLATPKMTFSDKDYYLKDTAEMMALFTGYDDRIIKNSLLNSVKIADMCDVSLDSDGYHLPLFEVPEGHTAETYVRLLCEQGLVWRYGERRAAEDEELRARLDHELNIIGRMGFETYFLIVWDLCEWAARSDKWWEEYQDPFPYSSYSEWKDNDIWWNVRGSGAGSVVAYSLGITSIDPLANGLIFERFLNPGRVSMPDIDLDYPDDVRHWMVAYTKRRYGAEKVAQIITFGTMGARGAIRDVGRALDMPLPEVNSVAQLIPAVPGKPVKIKNVFDEDHEHFNKELVERYAKEKPVRDLIDNAKSVEGLSRHASSHAAGVIVSDAPLQQYVPLNRPTSGDEGLGGVDRVTQWPMEVVEGIGLLKVDFLGLSTLTVMRRAARIIEKRYGTKYTMDNIPYDQGHVGPDPDKKAEAAFEMLARGEVGGVFQVEGAGMRRLMMEMKPARYDHIIAAISLYRPGPMENIPEYIRRMHSEIYDDKDIVTYHSDALIPILQDTYGIIVYQEQIIRIAAVLAGYEPGEADMIRKAVSKKKEKDLAMHKSQFAAGSLKNGITQEAIDLIWKDIEFFARYGFNKAHAADYAKVTCQTAFLKAHYPVEYLTAMLSVERNNTEKVQRYFSEAKNMGVDIGAPDINRSEIDFSIEDPEEEGGRPLIRFGLGAIKNAGDAALSLMLDDREENGRFESVQDLAERVDLRKVGKRPLEYAIKAGAFHGFGTVPQLLDGIDRMANYSGSQHDAAAAGQMSLFGGALAPVQMNVDLVMKEADLKKEFREADYKEVLTWEKEALGVYVSEHPLERPLATLAGQVHMALNEIDVQHNGKQLKVAGMVSSLRPLTTKKGDPMAFGKLEDLDGDIELVFFPRTWEAHRAEIQVDQVMLVYGKAQVDEGRRSILVDRVQTKFEQSMSADAASASKTLPAKSQQSQTSLNIEVKERSFIDPKPTPANDPPPWDDDSADSDDEIRELPDSAPRIDFANRQPATAEAVPFMVDEPIASDQLSVTSDQPAVQTEQVANDQSAENNQQSITNNQLSTDGELTNQPSNKPTNQQSTDGVPPLVTDHLPLVDTLPAEPEWDDGFFDPGPPPDMPPPPPEFGVYPAEPTYKAKPSNGNSKQSKSGNGSQDDARTIGETKPIYGRVLEMETLPTIVSISISSHSNWMEIIRKGVEIASRYPGKDCLNIEIVDQNQTIEFPNCKTRASEEMLSHLRQVTGIIEIMLLEQAPA